MKKLSHILTGIQTKQISGSVDIAISGIQVDSRRIKNGDLFVAVKGTRMDGHKFIPEAIKNGAVAVLYEASPGTIQKGITWIKVVSVPVVLGKLAATFYDHPSTRLKLIGVTGTNGKTSVATFLYQLLEQLGYPSGLISTVENKIHLQTVSSTLTTPDVVTVNKLLHSMVGSGCAYAFMEVSSHAIVQQRVSGLHFSGGVFTNLTHDHLDYHGDFKSYLRVKKEFFDNLPASAFALTNLDDKNGEVMMQNMKGLAKSYGIKRNADYKGNILERDLTGTRVKFNGSEVWLPFSGDFNVYNLLAVYGVAMELKLDNEETLKGISRLKPVPGRFESLRHKGYPLVIVDYAHTPDALQNVLESLSKIKNKGSEIYTVVGAGGDRDRTKRPEMGKLGALLSDHLILTSDNPRNENPERIIREIKEGIPGDKLEKVLSITDRKEAIRTACMMADENDVVLIAGKGHENYQIIGNKRFHFDDREIVQQIFTRHSNKQ